MAITVLENFQSNVESVKSLMSFDNFVLESAIEAIEDLHCRLRDDHGMTNPSLNGQRTLTILKGFHKNSSLRPKYQTIFNQGLVLLVSYFASAVHDLFRNSLEISIMSNPQSQVLSEELKITIRDLKDAEFDLRTSVADHFIRAKDISFQDMQSIKRAFKNYLDIDITKNEVVNEIILGQACRHVIVHAGAIINSSLLKQVASARPRTLKNNLVIGEKIQFDPLEVDVVAKNMFLYLESLSKNVSQVVGVNV